jgi:hypothetical protein
MNLLKRCLADPSTQSDSFAEQFLAPLVKQKLLDTQFESEKERKEQEQEVMAMAAMITVSRRFVLLTFICKVISEVLGIPFDELAPATSLLQPLKAVVRPSPSIQCVRKGRLTDERGHTGIGECAWHAVQGDTHPANLLQSHV